MAEAASALSLWSLCRGHVLEKVKEEREWWKEEGMKAQPGLDTYRNCSLQKYNSVIMNSPQISGNFTDVCLVSKDATS